MKPFLAVMMLTVGILYFKMKEKDIEEKICFISDVHPVPNGSLNLIIKTINI